jgi:CelD/BcsL family acetyltransferase involved in cellulose biosynthesis
MRTTVVTGIEDLIALRETWEELLVRSTANEATLSPPWMLAWWDVFGTDDDRELRTLAFHEGDRLVGLAPLLARDASYRPGLRFRRLELLGSGEPESDEICSDYLGVIADRGAEDAVADAFVQAIVEGRLGAWDEVVLPAMNGSTGMPRLLATQLSRHGVDVDLAERNQAPYLPLPSTWDAYLESLSPSRRAFIRRSLRRFESWAGAPPRLHHARTRAELAEAHQVLVALHGERWAEAGKQGVFDSRRFRAFHDRVMPELFDRNALDIGYLEAHGRPVSAFYNIVWDGRSQFYQSGRAVDVPRQVPVGVVMHACLIQDAIDRGLREYDFLAGTSRYKMTFATEMRPLVTLRAARRSLVEMARRATDVVVQEGRRLRDTVRRGWPPTP